MSLELTKLSEIYIIISEIRDLENYQKQKTIICVSFEELSYNYHSRRDDIANTANENNSLVVSMMAGHQQRVRTFIHMKILRKWHKFKHQVNCLLMTQNQNISLK